MSLLVFYHDFSNADGPRTKFIKGEGILVKGMNGYVVSLRTSEHEENIHTPIAVLDDSTTPPSLLMQQGRGDIAWSWYKGMSEMPPFFIDMNGDIRRSKDGACIMQVEPFAEQHPAVPKIHQ